ncbi:uncharacterized protein [Ambystoma mexicanum]|uniref:uncharacterized protein n=1 Tax=Ambystoma mexicanum TaxID=8296 RepID=UPI0037E85DBC
MSHITAGRESHISIDDDLAEKKDFIRGLYQFMTGRGTPIERIPSLGFKQIDLCAFYEIVQRLGGYEQVTLKQVWRQVYNELGGNPHSTSAATCTRKHYEKLILPYERHIHGQEQLPTSPPKAATKRCNRGIYKGKDSEEPRPDEKKTRLPDSTSWKDATNSAHRSINRVSMGSISRLTDYQQLWQQQQLERSVLFPSLQGMIIIPSTARATLPLSLEYSNHISRVQQREPNRSFIERPVAHVPTEPVGRHWDESQDGGRQELPLNLSSKRQSPEPSSGQKVQPDPSSSPTCTVPKFLNQVSSLYPLHQIPKAEGPLKSHVSSRDPCPGGSVAVVNNIVMANLHSPNPTYFRNPYGPLPVKDDYPDIAKPRMDTSLDLTADPASMMAPSARMNGAFAALTDITPNRLLKALPHELTMHMIPPTQSVLSTPDWQKAARSESHCKAPQVGALQPNQRAESDPLLRRTTDFDLYPPIKQSRFIDATNGDVLMTSFNNPGLYNTVYSKAHEGHALTVTSSPACRRENGEQWNSFLESCRRSCRDVPTSTNDHPSCLMSSAGRHLKVQSPSMPLSSTRPAHTESRFQNRGEAITWSQETPSLEASPQSDNRPLGLHYYGLKSKQATTCTSGALLKYLPLESHLKQLSEACFRVGMPTMPSPHQGYAMWNQPSQQRAGADSSAQKVLQKLQTFSPSIVS